MLSARMPDADLSHYDPMVQQLMVAGNETTTKLLNQTLAYEPSFVLRGLVDLRLRIV